MRPDTPEPPPASFERIVPRSPAADAPSRRMPVQGPGVSVVAVGLGMLGLLVLALLAFVVLPRLTATDAARPVPAAAPAAVAKPVPVTPPPAPTKALDARAVYDDPALLELRAEAQDLQQQFTEQSAQLAEKGVERWGAERLADASAQAQKAAAAFTAKDFASAKSGYEAAVAITEALLGEAPQRLATALQSGLAALAAGDKAAAQAAFELAAAIDPGGAAARRGLERVQSLDAVRVKLDTARRLEQIGDEAAAVAAWRAALQLDPDTVEASEALARIAAARSDTEFRRVLGDAITALDRGELGAAETRLARARALRAGDPGVQQAAGRLAEAQRGGKLAQLQADGTTQTATEDWAGAIASYRAALALDATIAFAREGLARAEPRAALASKLQGLIERPARLTSAAVAAEAENLLVQARAVADAGPRLQQQIATLRQAIDQSAQPVTVRLQSDNQTEVTIYKVGPQGRFATRELSLRPGRYTAVGARTGYRDVRREFEVAAGAAGPAVDVRCEEKL